LVDCSLSFWKLPMQYYTNGKKGDIVYREAN
jgi:hypothetical protein